MAHLLQDLQLFLHVKEKQSKIERRPLAQPKKNDRGMGEMTNVACIFRAFREFPVNLRLP
jgi:hypothetical protein